MTTKERVGITKAFAEAIMHAHQYKQYLTEYEEAQAKGDTITAVIRQRQADLSRGNAHGVAQTLALIGNSADYVKAIYEELGE